MLDANFSFTIYDSTQDLPQSWDNLAKNNIFLSKDYLKILEFSAPSNMSCNFIGLFYNNNLAGIAISQFIDLSRVDSFGERDHLLKSKFRNLVFKRFVSNVLILGNNMLTGQNSFCFGNDLPAKKGVLLLNEAANELKKTFSKKGNQIHLTIFKDFYDTNLVNFKHLDFKSFFRFSTQPNMIFQVEKNWDTFDNYLESKSKKYRDQYKRARKKAEGITKRKLSLEEIQNHQLRIHQLYMNVARNAPFNTFHLPLNHFHFFKETLKDKFLFYGYFNNNKLIGFNTLIKNGADIDTYFLGYDEKCQREKMLYLNMLYDMINYCINKKFSRIIFARTALEIKSSVGAKAIPMFGLIKHNNPLINLLVPKSFGFFEPEIQWKQRNPFIKNQEL